MLTVFPPLTPPALSRPAGRKREPTALFGRVFKRRKYTCQGTLWAIDELAEEFEHAGSCAVSACATLSGGMTAYDPVNDTDPWEDVIEMGVTSKVLLPATLLSIKLSALASIRQSKMSLWKSNFLWWTSALG